MTTTTAVFSVLTLLYMAALLLLLLQRRELRFKLENAQARQQFLMGCIQALEEDSNVRTAKTLREDIMVVAAHRTMLMEQAAQNVAEMDRMRRELRAARGVPERAEVEAFTQ